MSTNCPPQLHLTLPSNTTSFKRSFEQFGFDLESPIGSAEASSTQSASSGSDGNDRNKRARSASSASQSSGIMDNSSPSVASSASSSAINVLENESADASGLTSTRPPALALSMPHRHSYLNQSLSFLDVPRLPTPDLQDIVMSEYPSVATPQSSPSRNSPIQPSITQHDEQYRMSLERFNAFDSQISALRQSRSPPAVRSPTPPPVLPPLSLSSDVDDHDGLHTLHTSTNPTLVPVLPDSPDNNGFPSPSRFQVTGALERFESRLEGRVWPHNFLESPMTSIVPESRAPQADPPPHDHSPSFTSSRLFASVPETVPREDLSPITDFTTINRSRLPRPRVEPNDHTIIRHQHMMFRDRLDSALDVLRSSSPLFSDAFPREESTSSTTQLRTRTPDDVEHTQVNTRSSIEPIQRDQSWEDCIPTRASTDSSSRPEGFSFLPERTRRQPESDLPHVSIGNNDTSVSSHATSLRTRLDPRIFDFDRRRLLDRETDAVMNELGRATHSSHHHSWRGAPEARLIRGDSGPGHTTGFSHSESSDSNEEGAIPHLEHSPSEHLPVSRQPVGSLHFQPLMRHNVVEPETISQSERIVRSPQFSDTAEGVQGWRPLNGNMSRALRPPSTRDSRPVIGHRTTDSSASTRFRLSSDIPNLTEYTETESFRARNPMSQLGSTSSSLHRMYPRTRSSRVGVSNSLVAENAAELRQRVARAQLTLEFSGERSQPLDVLSDDEAVWNHEHHPRPRLHRWSSVGDTETTQPHRDIQEYLTSGPPPRVGQSNITSVNTSAHSQRASIFTGRTGDPFDSTGSSSRNYHHSHTSSWTGDGDLAEGNRAAPLLDTYEPYADGLANSFDLRSQNVPTSTQSAALFASAPSVPSRRTSVNLTRQHPETFIHASNSNQTPSPPFSLPMPDLTGFYAPLVNTLERNHSPSPLQLDLNPDARPRFRPRLSGTSRFPSPSLQERESRPLHSFTRPSSSTLPGSNQSSTYRNIDLTTYHDGPFRASLQRFVELDRMRSRLHRLESLANGTSSGSSNPPSIPPLPFEEDFSPFNGGEPEVDTTSPTWGPPTPRRDLEVRQERPVESVGPTRTDRNQFDDVLESFVVSSRDRPVFRSYGGSARAYDSAQDRRDMYSFLNRQPRIEASRIETGPILPPRQRPIEGIDMRRRDGPNSTRQQQRIEHYRLEHSQNQERRQTPIFWGDVEGESEGSQSLPPRPRYMNHSRAEPFGSARTYSTAPGTSTRHRASSRSPVRDDSGPQARLLARARLQGRRRLDSESIFGNLQRMGSSSHGGLRRRGRAFGDYMRDEDFDSSYENLLSIATALGEAKSRGVPEHVITSLPTGFYKDWVTRGSDQRCPICLDDYKSLDRVLKLSDCSHWLHKGCLEQWLRGANTCPVCRKCVNGTRGQNEETVEDPGLSGSGQHDGDGGGGDEGGSPWNSNPPPAWRYSLR